MQGVTKMNIERVTTNLKKNAVPLVLGVGGVAVLYALFSQKETESVLVPATGYASYPDSVTNANVIIGEVNDHTTAEVAQLREEQKEGVNNILDSIGTQTDYIGEGIDRIIENADKNTDTVVSKIETENDLVEKVSEKQDSLMETINKNTSILQTDIKTATNNVNSNLQKVQSNIQSTVKGQTDITKMAIDKAVKTKKIKGNVGTEKKDNTSYYKKASYKGGSIVDGLKAIGVNSSYSNRAKIAKANGIKNYTGTSSQNTKLLNLLKAGKLKKV